MAARVQTQALFILRDRYERQRLTTKDRTQRIVDKESTKILSSIHANSFSVLIRQFTNTFKCAYLTCQQSLVMRTLPITWNHIG